MNYLPFTIMCLSLFINTQINDGISLNIIQIYSGITSGRVLDGELLQGIYFISLYFKSTMLPRVHCAFVS